MALANFRILIHQFLNKGTYIVPEPEPLIILDSKSAVCMAKNGNYTNNTRQIYRRVHYVRNGEKREIHKIDWCEEGLKLPDIVTTRVG